MMLPPRPGQRRTRNTSRAPLGLGLLLLLAPAARAQEPEEPGRPLVPEPMEGPAPLPPPLAADDTPPWSPRFGLRLGAGSPEGVGVSALMQPRPWLRVHVGGTRNSLGNAVHGGVDLLPLRLFVSPVLALTYGHAFRLDYAGLLSRLHGTPTTPGTGIERVDAEQLGATLGLELSPWRPVTFFAGAGIGYWFIRVTDARAFIREAGEDPDVTSQPLSLGISTPVARLGVIVYFN